MSSHSQFALLKQRRFLPFFVTQAFGAFNDNVYRQAIIGLLFFLGVSAQERTLYTNLAPALFILPYFLFSATAGQIAEKLEKSRLIRITTTMEIAIMSLAAIGFVTQNMVVLLVALFCTGLQSTLFGPVKYSILPSVLKPEELTGGNGLVEMGTSISILVGMIFGGLIFKIAGEHGPEVAATAIIVLAISGNLVSRAIPRAEAGAPDLKINWNPIPESLAVLRLAKKQVAVRNCDPGRVLVLVHRHGADLAAADLCGSQPGRFGNAVHLRPGAVLHRHRRRFAAVRKTVGAHGRDRPGAAGRIRHQRVPAGPVLRAQRRGRRPADWTVMQFVRQPGSWRIVMDLVGIGLFTGFFVVPLFALIQSRTPKDELSRVIAGMNIQNAAFIVLAAVLGIVLQMKQLNLFGQSLPMPGLSIPQVFLALAIANAVVAIWIFTLVPEFLMRFLSWVLVRVLYRLRLHGIEKNVPDEGAALLVCNHVSYMDALILVGQRAAAGALRHVLQDLQDPGDELDLPHRQGDPDRRRARESRTDAGARSTRSTRRWPTARWSASFPKAR